MQKKDLIAIRSLEPTDLGLIYDSWLKGLRYDNSWFELIDEQIYFKTYFKFIENLIKRPTISVSVACLREEPDIILGYSVYEPEILHWVFVKQAWRGIGIFKDLVPPNTKVVTHMTNMGLRMKPSHVMFNPFLERTI